MNKQTLQFIHREEVPLTFVLEPWGDVFSLLKGDTLVLETAGQNSVCQVTYEPHLLSCWLESNVSFLSVKHYDEHEVLKRSEVFVDDE